MSEKRSALSVLRMALIAAGAASIASPVFAATSGGNFIFSQIVTSITSDFVDVIFKAIALLIAGAAIIKIRRGDSEAGIGQSIAGLGVAGAIAALPQVLGALNVSGATL